MVYIGDAVGRINSNSERLNDCKETEFEVPGLVDSILIYNMGKKKIETVQSL